MPTLVSVIGCFFLAVRFRGLPVPVPGLPWAARLYRPRHLRPLQCHQPTRVRVQRAVQWHRVRAAEQRRQRTGGPGGCHSQHLLLHRGQRGERQRDLAEVWWHRGGPCGEVWGKCPRLLHPGVPADVTNVHGMWRCFVALLLCSASQQRECVYVGGGGGVEMRIALYSTVAPNLITFVPVCLVSCLAWQLVRLETNSTDADPILMSRSNLPPSLADYELLDLKAWSSKRSLHNIASPQVRALLSHCAVPVPRQPLLLPWLPLVYPVHILDSCVCSIALQADGVPHCRGTCLVFAGPTWRVLHHGDEHALRHSTVGLHVVLRVRHPLPALVDF